MVMIFISDIATNSQVLKGCAQTGKGAAYDVVVDQEEEGINICSIHKSEREVPSGLNLTLPGSTENPRNLHMILQSRSGGSKKYRLCITKTIKVTL